MRAQTTEHQLPCHAHSNSCNNNNSRKHHGASDSFRFFFHFLFSYYFGSDTPSACFHALSSPLTNALLLFNNSNSETTTITNTPPTTETAMRTQLTLHALLYYAVPLLPLLPSSLCLLFHVLCVVWIFTRCSNLSAVKCSDNSCFSDKQQLLLHCACCSCTCRVADRSWAVCSSLTATVESQADRSSATHEQQAKQQQHKHIVMQLTAEACSHTCKRSAIQRDLQQQHEHNGSEQQ